MYYIIMKSLSTILLIWNIFLTFQVNCKYQQSDDKPRVQTPLGGIRGYYDFTYEGRKYEAYEGIPYALPPVRKLRFKPPQKIPEWQGDLPATKFGSECLQYAEFPQNPKDKVEGSEDCLYLNVYVPYREFKTKKLYPVIFYIHGGAFMHGAGSKKSPKYLLDYDVIFVTSNYRLGPLGFLSTEDKLVPGNMGLKDQNMALKWVSDNIESFGGNPKKITLAGLSAGGASVHYHYLSPLSANLFQRGMSFSGTTLDPWSLSEHSLLKANKLGSIMDCPTNSTKELVRCLRTRPARTLVQAVEEFMPWNGNPFTPFGPVVEKGNSEKSFITRSPMELIASGDIFDVPWITTVTSEEGIYPILKFANDKKALKELDDNWVTLAPFLLDFNNTIAREKHAEVSNSIRQHYLGAKPIDKSTIKEMIQMAGDRHFYIGAEKAVRAQAKANDSPVWFYFFSYRGANSFSEVLLHTKENHGVSHADDVFYVVDVPFLDTTTTEDDQNMQKELLNLWITFATEGIPEIPIEWPKLDPWNKEFHFLQIEGPGKYSITSNVNFGEKKFWKTIDFNENKVKSRSKDEL